MTVRVAINGFGRIGRSIFRLLARRNDIDIIAINDLYDNEHLAYLLQYDTIMGIFERQVSFDEDHILVDDCPINITKIKDPSHLPWADFNIDVVVESTGVFRKKIELEGHLKAGSKRVLLTVPAKDQIDAMIVMSVNDHILEKQHRIVSNASCTTNCLAPIAKVLDDEFGIDHGIITTVHAYTNDQHLADVPHSDPRRSRAATENIIPTTTGAARAVGKVIPNLEGRLDGMAARVPIPNGSIIDLTAKLKSNANRTDINEAMSKAANGSMRNILQYASTPLVSSDIIGNPNSSIFDSLLTQASSDGYCRVLSWYDNEWGYANRCVDLIARLRDLDCS